MSEPTKVSPACEVEGNDPASTAWIEGMVDRAYDYAEAARQRGAPIVGIMCEFTSRELILAAGGVPVCLCGGSASMVPVGERCLPSNLCPLIKSTYGYLLQGNNPFLRWADLVVAETTCDGKKKMFELMAGHKPMHVLELPQRADAPEALAYWTQELRRFQAALETRFRVALSGERIEAAIALMNRERRLRRQLAELMFAERPPLTGRQLLGFSSIISGLPADLEHYEAALRFYHAGGASTGSPKAKPQRDLPVRVLLTGVPVVHGAERVVDLIEGCGAMVVAMENCTGLKPIREDVVAGDPDPVAALARKYFHLPCSVMTPNRRRIDSLRELAHEYRAQAVVDLVWQACLTYDVESHAVRQLMEEELHLPYLKISTTYSPSDTAYLRSRLEALVELVRAQTGPGAGGDGL